VFLEPQLVAVVMIGDTGVVWILALCDERDRPIQPWDGDGWEQMNQSRSLVITPLHLTWIRTRIILKQVAGDKHRMISFARFSSNQVGPSGRVPPPATELVAPAARLYRPSGLSSGLDTR
jgi:hypothetical protein